MTSVSRENAAEKRKTRGALIHADLKAMAGVDYPDFVGLYILASLQKESAPRWVVEHVLIHTKVATFRFAKKSNEQEWIRTTA